MARRWTLALLAALLLACPAPALAEWADEEGEAAVAFPEEGAAEEDPADADAEGWDELADGTHIYLRGGERVLGWLLDGGSWYWLEDTAAGVAEGWRCIHGAWYLFGDCGEMLTGWQDPAGDATWYWLDPATGRMGTGWLFEGGSWYYLLPSGAMARGAFRQADGHWAVAARDGSWRHVSDWPELDDLVIPIASARGLDLRACYDHVIGGTYRYLKRATWPSYDHWEEDYALKFISDGGGNCYGFASTFHFLARACGLDTVVRADWILGARTGRMGPHGWCEAVIGGVTYVFDPDLEYEVPECDGYFQVKNAGKLRYLG